MIELTHQQVSAFSIQLHMDRNLRKWICWLELPVHSPMFSSFLKSLAYSTSFLFINPLLTLFLWIPTHHSHQQQHNYTQPLHNINL